MQALPFLETFRLQSVQGAPADILIHLCSVLFSWLAFENYIPYICFNPKFFFVILMRSFSSASHSILLFYKNPAIISVRALYPPKTNCVRNSKFYTAINLLKFVVKTLLNVYEKAGNSSAKIGFQNQMHALSALNTLIRTPTYMHSCTSNRTHEHTRIYTFALTHKHTRAHVNE